MGLDADLQQLIRLKPKSLSRFTELLQLGSKNPSVAYSTELKGLLWDKLVATFPNATHNGVRIPGLKLGETFLGAYPDRGAFPVEQFTVLIAVAFGKALRFTDRSAIDFTPSDLFAPKFGLDLQETILAALKQKLPGDFDRFEMDGEAFIDLSTLEIFDVANYLSEIQFAYDIAPSVDFASLNFKLSDLQDALFPNKLPTLRSFADFVKGRIVEFIADKLSGLFATGVDISNGGLTIETPELGGDGLALGSFSPASTRAFPPRISTDSIQVRKLVNQDHVYVSQTDVCPHSPGFCF